MTRVARIRVVGKLDRVVPIAGTLTLYRDTGLMGVRPHRRRREYILPAGAVADMIVARVVKAELAARLDAKKKPARRGRRRRI